MSDNNVFEKIDPILGQALAEIQPILEKYDLGAFIQVQTKDASEFVTVFPTWSAAHFTVLPDGKTALAVDKAPDDLPKEAHGEQTIGFLLTMRDTCARQSLVLDSVMKNVAKELGIDIQALFARSKQSSTPPDQLS